MSAHRRLFPAVLTAPVLFAAVAFAAPRAAADGFSITLGKHSKHGSIGVTFSNGGFVHPCPPPPCAPPPRCWEPGHFEERCERVWVPGAPTQVWVAPVYEWRRDACGRSFQVCVRPGHWETVCSPGRWEERRTRVWVEGHWR
jgi:hypothetical protein